MVKTSRLLQIAQLEVSSKIDVTEPCFSTAFKVPPLSFKALQRIGLDSGSGKSLKHSYNSSDFYDDDDDEQTIPARARSYKVQKRLNFEKFLDRFEPIPKLKQGLFDLLANLEYRHGPYAAALTKISELSKRQVNLDIVDLLEELYVLIGTLAMYLAEDAKRPSNHTQDLLDHQQQQQGQLNNDRTTVQEMRQKERAREVAALETAKNQVLLGVLVRVRDSLASEDSFAIRIQRVRTRSPNLSDALAQLSPSPSVHSVHVELGHMTKLFEQTKRKHQDQEDQIGVLEGDVEALKRNIEWQKSDEITVSQEIEKLTSQLAIDAKV